MTFQSQGNIEFYTFATFGDFFNHNDYSDTVERLRENLLSFGYTLRVIGLDEIWEDLSEKQKQIIQLRKGAGYMTWKAAVLRYVMVNSISELSVYMDADLRFLKSPDEFISESIGDHSFALFPQTVPLHEFTSKKCLKYFDLVENEKNYMWSSGFFILRNKNEGLSKFINEWHLALGNTSILIDPLHDFRLKHRHDQSLLSCLITKTNLDFIPIKFGLFSNGIERSTDDLSQAMVLHADPNFSSPTRIMRFKSLLSLIRHKTDLILWYFKILFRVI